LHHEGCSYAGIRFASASMRTAAHIQRCSMGW
jgi:hypothetical protein